MKRVLVAFILIGGIAAIAFAALDSSSNNNSKKKKDTTEQKKDVKKKKECKRSCFLYS